MPQDIEHPNSETGKQNNADGPVGVRGADAQGEGASQVTTPAGDADQVRRERDEYYDRLLRKTAEFDNYRKRVERERREWVRQAEGDVLEALLPIVDDFERALRVEAGPDAESYRKGVELIHKQLLDLLARRGATPIEAVGKPFDPHVHQAISQEASAEYNEGDVIEEVRRGYMLGDRLLRPAMVKVAKA